MDAQSWTVGYLTGAALHSRVRIPQLFPNVIAALSATGIAADLDWRAELSGVAAITMLSAEYVGDVEASYSYDGRRYTEAVPMAELLAANPDALFHGRNPANPSLHFRFHLADDAADLKSFTLWGFMEGELGNGV